MDCPETGSCDQGEKEKRYFKPGQWLIPPTRQSNTSTELGSLDVKISVLPGVSNSGCQKGNFWSYTVEGVHQSDRTYVSFLPSSGRVTEVRRSTQRMGQNVYFETEGGTIETTVTDLNSSLEDKQGRVVYVHSYPPLSN